MTQAQWIMNSKIGRLYLVASGKGLQGVFWTKQPVQMAKSLRGPEPEIRILSKAVRELKEYLAGKRKKFALPLDPKGTPFQKRVWKQLERIPYGKTCSYKDIAVKIRNGKAFRAIGTANGENPLCIIVPCHRVISADGSLGGYSAGTHIKTRLLALEKSYPRHS